MKRFTAIISIAVLAALSAAQGGGGGRMGGMMTQGGGGPSMLVNREDVQTDLKITAEQKSKLTALQEKQRDEMRAAFQEMRDSGGGGGFDQDAMRKMMEKRMKQSEKDVNAILTSEQIKRLKEIWVQVSGNSVISNEDIQKDLAMTDEQKKKVKDLQAKQQEAMMSVMEKMRNGELDREEMQDIFKKNGETLNKELGKVLTAEQATKLKEMGGKPFKAAERKDGG